MTTTVERTDEQAPRLPRWRRVLSRVRTVPVLGVLLCWVFFGLVGHDPWKPDEAYTFGLVLHIVRTGHWIVPTLAGEPFMEKPPFYFWTAALSARLFSPWLPLYDGARLASGFFLIVILGAVGSSARALFGRSQGLPAALFLAGSLGLLIDSHAMITDVALLAGFALALAGFSVALEKPRLAGALVGIGTGMGFMAKGLFAPGVLGLVAVLLPLAGGLWRKRAYAASLAWALLWASPWLLIWPVALYERSPHLFAEWLWANNWGRFLGFAHLGPVNGPGFYPKTLWWYALPSWPFALWSAWRRRLRWKEDPGLQLTVLLFATTLAVLMASHDSRALYAMPVLPPLAVLATAEFAAVSTGVARFFGRFSMLFFGAAVAILWLAWGVFWIKAPGLLYAPLERVFATARPQLVMVPLVLAIAATLLFLLFLQRWRRQWHAGRPLSGLKAWVAGLTTVWILLTTIWLPPINAIKSYRAMMESLAGALPANGCVSSENLGEPQRALLDYYDALVTQRISRPAQSSCNDLLVCEYPGAPPSGIAAGWQPVWHGYRVGDPSENYTLFRRQPAIASDFPRSQSWRSRDQAAD